MLRKEKSFMKKKIFLAILLILVVAACSVCDARTNREMKLRLVNHTGKTIVSVYLKPSKYGDYEAEDELNENSPLRNGEFIDMKFFDKTEHREPHDIMIVFRDNTYDEWTELNFDEFDEMTFEKDGSTSYRLTR